MSNASFIVTTTPPRMRREDITMPQRHETTEARQAASRVLFVPPWLRSGGFPLHRLAAAVFAEGLAVLDGDQLGEDADGDFLRRDGADVEADGRVDVLERLGRHLVGEQLVVDARHLGAAADEAEIAQLARRQRAQRLEVVRVAPRDDRPRTREREAGAARSTPGCRPPRSRRRPGNRSRLANFSRSSTTWTRNPTSWATRAR